ARRRGGAVLVGVFIPLLLTELWLRLAGSGIGTPRLPLPYDVETIERFSAGQNWVSFDSELGWVPTPNFDYKRTERYHHNSQGLRADREYAALPTAGVRRIAAYGDSITYCADRNLEECWTWLLERQLPESEVLNFGVPGYGPIQPLLP